MADDLRLKMLDDLLQAERGFRDLAERQVRALVGVLTELAYRLDGERLERLRQLDPGAPATWQPQEWRQFFLAVSLTPQEGWGKPDGNGRPPEVAAPPARIAALERELAQCQTASHERKGEVDNPPASQGASGRLAGFQMPKIPQAFAHRWQVRTPMSQADEALHLRRRGMVLKCLAEGLNVQVEIGRYVGEATAAQYRSGAIRRVFDALEESGLILRQTLSMSVTRSMPTRLALARLSQEGGQLCKALSWRVVESEWERLLRLHQGAQQEEHTLSVLLFAAAARLRGWQVETLPEVAGNARPDVVIRRGEERVYVEVETGTRLHQDNAKWRMNAELNGGKVALVARNGEERRVLVADCQQVAPHGMATDVETLIGCKFAEVSQDHPLWAEEW